MTVRPIMTFPDARLRLPAEPVTSFDAGLHALAADLLDTMRAAPGIGITAPHIGVSQRLVVLELPGNGVRHYANPVIVWASAERIRHPEGSVSMPGVTEEVERHARVRLRYQDLHGAEQTEEAEGLSAICHQHEIDQLDGIFWLQRLSRLKRERLVKRYEKLRNFTADPRR
jgi:peptide deformylase